MHRGGNYRETRRRRSALLAFSLMMVTAGMAWAEDWLCKVVSVQGKVEARKAGTREWVEVQMDDMLFAGDTLRTMQRSRAALLLRNGSIARLDENTTLTLVGLEEERTSVLDLIWGGGFFFNRAPSGLKVLTPYVNAGVEGTEFFLGVDEGRSLLSVVEGSVVAANASGTLRIRSGQSALAQAGQAPAFTTTVRPRDAVQWTLYFPPILHHRLEDLGGTEGSREALRKSVELFRKGDLPGAFAAIDDRGTSAEDAELHVYRASLLLAVGRVSESEAALALALGLDPGNSNVHALRAIIAVTRNEKEDGLRLARRAVELDRASSSALIALSYAQQASFDLGGARESLRRAVSVQPADALAWARLAEIELSHGRLGKARDAARQSISLDPELAHGQTILGFALLTEAKTLDAKQAFGRAIRLAPADPMPRLGLGLALIREGSLEEGRREIEIAAILDPERSLIRSYLGKAYFEEKRDRQAAEQLSTAKGLDPLDPTPWYYDALRKQTVNRPVEGLEDLQKSMELNDNRAVYRSRLLLDADSAARSASLARIYIDLGFQWLALAEGWKSITADPSNHSAHRFLADTYFSLPRHEIARVSELLQSQLLQPLNIRPNQPQLAESRFVFPGGGGPRGPSYNEYTTLFERDRLSLLVSGAAGERGTFADEVVFSGILGGFSYSVGQLHSETDGFRLNNNQRSDIYDIFFQANLTARTSAQVEYRRLDSHFGDILVNFDPAFFGRHTREEHSSDTFRFGFHHAFSPESDLIASFFYKSSEDDFFLRPFTTPFPLDTLYDSTGYGVELQHILRLERFSLITGAGHFNTSNDEEFVFFGESFPSRNKTPHTNGYIYSHVRCLPNMTWTLGLSVDDFSGGSLDLDVFQVNPKFGLTWEPFPGTTLRGAAFRTLKRTLLTNQTVEPTQVAGFNQFFDDGEGTDAWRYGIGLDQKLTDRLYGGVEFSWRNLEVPAIDVGPDGIVMVDMGVREKQARAYLYWAPHQWFSIGPEYQFEQFDNPDDFTLNGIREATTNRVALGAGFFHPNGFIARLRPAFVAQHGVFLNKDGGREYADSEFFVVDASIGYRLPGRLGLIEIEARNLFDDGFRFQDTDPQNPRITPGRFILGKWTFSF